MLTVVKLITLFRASDKIYMLLLRRSPQATICPEMEDLPGGKVETDEVLIDAIKRELKEETGLVVEKVYPFAEHEWSTRERQLRKEYIFYGFVDTQQVQLNAVEHSGHRWVTFEDITTSDLHPELKKIILANLSILPSIRHR